MKKILFAICMVLGFTSFSFAQKQKNNNQQQEPPQKNVNKAPVKPKWWINPFPHYPSGPIDSFALRKRNGTPYKPSGKNNKHN